MATRIDYTKEHVKFLYSMWPVLGLGLLVMGASQGHEPSSSPEKAEALEMVEESVMPEYLEPDADGDWYRLAPPEPWYEPSHQS